MLTWFRSRNATGRTATKLYGSIVTQSRLPDFYTAFGVPDTLDGRFGILVVHTTLLVHRLEAEGTDGLQLARALIEAFVTDMDDNMREIGVGDLSVPRKVKKAAAAIYDRRKDYIGALRSGDAAELARLLGRHIAGDPDWHAGPALADYVQVLSRALERQPGAALLAGDVDFPLPAVAHGARL